MPAKKNIRKTTPRTLPLVGGFNFRGPAPLAAMTVVVLTGIYIVMRILAAQLTSFEAEGARTGNVALLSDPDASGGQYIQFGTVAGTTPPPATPPPATPPPATPPPVTPPPSAGGARCRVNLHGKSGLGQPTYQSGDVTVISPNGNHNSSWGNLEWLYFPEGGYQEVRTIISNAINAQTCGQVVVNGFSNGGGAAAKLYCRGETFGGKVVGIFINDPVPDAGTDSCTPNVANVHLFRSGSLEGAIVGGDCAGMDWTCEGGVLYPLATYVSKLHLNSNQYDFDQNAGHSESPQTDAIISSWWQ